jgi:hypothetical protein
MSSDSSKLTEAAMAVMRALEGLSPEDCARVLGSAAALFKVSSPAAERLPAGEMPLDEDTASEGRAKRRSLAEFIIEKGPATNAQRIAVFAYYREHVEKKSTFGRADLQPYFAMAKAPRPGNYDRDFSAAAKEGWIHEEGESSYLTATGESVVNAGFGGKAKPRGRAVAKKARKLKAATSK